VFSKFGGHLPRALDSLTAGKVSPEVAQGPFIIGHLPACSANLGNIFCGPWIPSRRKSKVKRLKSPLLLAIFRLVPQVWGTSSAGPGFPHAGKVRLSDSRVLYYWPSSCLFSKFGEHLPLSLDFLTTGKVSLSGSMALYYWPCSDLFSRFGEHLPRALDSLTAGKVSLRGSRALYNWPSSDLYSKDPKLIGLLDPNL
jgi:hypothetical protein